MACSTILSRLSSLRSRPVSCNLKSLAAAVPPLKSPASLPAKRVSAISRLPVELGCLFSMMPLHNAVASARLRSCLSAESQSWGLIPQGLCMPL